ncbi:hypothetical protein CLU79DRAFT_832162 [Phycomyces nitens]|nr:hypothetical protein CLU79DRAFT_832162 [Phycomyces nitens]
MSAIEKTVVLWHLQGCMATFYDETPEAPKEKRRRIPTSTQTLTTNGVLSHRHLERMTIAGPAVPYLAALTSLTLQNNRLSELPDELWRLYGLKELNLGCNRLERLPVEVGLLVNLEELYVHNNQLSALPVQLANLSRLRILDLTGNALMYLPVEVKDMSLSQLWADQNPFGPLNPDRLSKVLSLRSICAQIAGRLKLNTGPWLLPSRLVSQLSQQDSLTAKCSICHEPLFHQGLLVLRLEDLGTLGQTQQTQEVQQAREQVPVLYRTCSQRCRSDVYKIVSKDTA